MSNIEAMRPTSTRVSRRAKNHGADWMMDRRTSPRVNRKTATKAALREAGY